MHNVVRDMINTYVYNIATANSQHYESALKLSLNPRTKALKGSKNQPKALGASCHGGWYVSLRGRLLGLASGSSTNLSSGSSRVRLVPRGKGVEGLISEAIKVPSVEAEAEEGGGRSDMVGNLIGPELPVWFIAPEDSLEAMFVVAVVIDALSGLLGVLSCGRISNDQ
jgi:hypothetical protein